MWPSQASRIHILVERRGMCLKGERGLVQRTAHDQASGGPRIPPWRTRRSRYYPCRLCGTALSVAGPLKWQALTWQEGWCWVEPPAYEPSVWWLEFHERHPHRHPVDRISARVETDLIKPHSSPWMWVVFHPGSRWKMRGEAPSIEQAIRCVREAAETSAPLSAQRRFEVCTRLQTPEADANCGPLPDVSRLNPPRRDKRLAITRLQMGIVAPDNPVCRLNLITGDSQ